MTEDFTTEQIILMKEKIKTISSIQRSPEISALLDLAFRAKNPRVRPPNQTVSLKEGKPIRCIPVIIVAGGTDKLTKKSLLKYRTLLTEGFYDFTGTIISGGTTAGVCGIVGDVQETYEGAIKTIGYLPGTIPPTTAIDPRYYEIRKTDGDKFSIKEPLQYWTDILASCIPPSDVKLIGINGGNISAAEYRIALLLGAKVGIIQNSGRAVAELLEDPDWNTSENLIVLPHDVATLRAFIGFGAGFQNRNEREELAQQIHEEYRRMQLTNPQTDPSCSSLVPWKDLDPGLKDSNRNQADHTFAKLRETGYKLRKVKQANPRIVLFTSGEVEHLAELEHGRWNVERLLNGWKYGPAKDVANKRSPYIIPWVDLPEDIREWDRNPVRQLPAILAKMGYGMYKKPMVKKRRDV